MRKPRGRRARAGFSILESLLALSLAAGLFMTVLSLIDTAGKGNRGVQATSDFSDLVYLLSHTVFDRQACEAALSSTARAARTPPLPAVPIGGEVALSVPNGQGGTQLIQAGAKAASGLIQIEHVRLTQIGPNQGDPYPNPPGQAIAFLNLSVQAKKVALPGGTGNMGAAEISRTFIFAAEIAPGNSVAHCLDPVRNGCLSLGGNWDPVQGTCNLTHVCRSPATADAGHPAQVFLGFTIGGGSLAPICAKFGGQSCDVANSPFAKNFYWDMTTTGTPPLRQPLKLDPTDPTSYGSVQCGSANYNCPEDGTNYSNTFMTGGLNTPASPVCTKINN